MPTKPDVEGNDCLFAEATSILNFPPLSRRCTEMVQRFFQGLTDIALSMQSETISICICRHSPGLSTYDSCFRIPCGSRGGIRLCTRPENNRAAPSIADNRG